MPIAMKRLASTSLAVFAAFAVTSTAVAQGRPTAPMSWKADVGAPPVTTPASSKIDVVVKLADAPLAVAQGAQAKQRGKVWERAQANNYLLGLNAKQDGLMAMVRGMGGIELARLSRTLNAVVITVDANMLPVIRQLPGVVSVRPVGTYTLDLTETVPYIGAAAARQGGKDGSGVRVAVLDSGIDYTHRNLGGPGTVGDYSTCYGQRDVAPSGPCASLFGPAAPKVIGGFDFVGEAWPNGNRSEDPNPIDAQGHGTHVADIIAGYNASVPHYGVAPGAKLYAVKVCSAVATSCNGVALLKGMEYVLDPNGDGDMSDAVDVVNMSLGSSYGQREDDLSEASANAVRYGVIVVVSAGNSADRPYIVGSPSSTPEVISVAQTQVPGAKAFPLTVNSPAAIAGQKTNTATLDWAPIAGGFTGNVATAQSTGAPNNLACAALAAGSLAGKVALVDRGTCSISAKVKNASDAGAIGVLVGLVAPGDAQTFSNGGDCPATPDGTCKPSLVITQADSNAIKANIAAPVNVTVSTSNFLSLAGSMVASSSRGPSFSYSAIKPDIGAPGASISAIAGTGNGTEAFGGTSGAAPMVSGAAAILVQAFPKRSPAEIKSVLMNTSNNNIQTNPATLPGQLAPVSRIGAGEVRVDRALDSSVAAWDTVAQTGSLSFGYMSSTSSQSMSRSVTVRNYSTSARTLNIASSFRYANDAASGAVTIRVPSSITVRANSTAQFNVQMTIDPSKLPAWSLNGGLDGGNGPLLQSVEFDGYITLSDGNFASAANTAPPGIALPWHVLPQKSADVAVSKTSIRANTQLKLSNRGPAATTASVFALTGTSDRLPREAYPVDGDNFATIDLKSVGVRQSVNTLQFAINTWGERAHPNYPAEFDIYIDTNNDGTPDFVAYNLELNGFGATGQNAVALVNLSNNSGAIYYYTIADLNSANAVLTVPMSALGITAATKINFSVYAFDNYFTGNLTDWVENMTFTPGTPRFAASAADIAVPAGGSVNTVVSAVGGGAAASPSQTGLLLFYKDGKRGNEAQTVKVSAP